MFWGKDVFLQFNMNVLKRPDSRNLKRPTVYGAFWGFPLPEKASLDSFYFQNLVTSLSDCGSVDRVLDFESGGTKFESHCSQHVVVSLGKTLHPKWLLWGLPTVSGGLAIGTFVTNPEVGRSDDVGRSDKSLAPPSPRWQFTSGTEVGRS